MFPHGVMSAAWHAGARCLFEKGPSHSPRLLLSLHRCCFFPTVHYWSREQESEGLLTSHEESKQPRTP